MTLLDHIDELRARLVRIIAAITIVIAATFTLSLKEFTFGDTKLILPYPDPSLNISSQLIAKLRDDLLPRNVELIVTAPGQALLSQLQVSLFLGVILSMPVIIWEVIRFIGPALYPSERKLIAKILLPATALFAAGVLFSYFYMTPFTIRFLYDYAAPMVTRQFITIDELIGFTLLFLVAFGLSFQLPIVMWAVTRAGIVDKEFWRRNFSYAVIAFVVYGAVVTPDGSGYTMFFVAIPMILLYGATYLFLRRVKPL